MINDMIKPQTDSLPIHHRHFNSLEIEKHTKAFLSRNGRIKEIPMGVTGDSQVIAKNISKTDNIYEIKTKSGINSFKVKIGNHLYGTFKTMDEAIEVRDKAYTALGITIPKKPVNGKNQALEEGY